jgi:hypothetical protein
MFFKSKKANTDAVPSFKRIIIETIILFIALIIFGAWIAFKLAEK